MSPRTYSHSHRRSRWPKLLIGGIGLSTLVVVGIVGTLWLLGVPLNPFAVPTEDPYVVRIPINAQPIPAYSRVDRSHLMNPGTGGLMFQNLPPAMAVGMSIVGIDAQGSHVESRIESIRRDRDEVVFVVEGGAEVRQAQTFELGGAIMNVNAIIGRVVKKDKRPGLGFQETTFFPQGTPEGLAGATPEGMRAITLDATKLTGVHALNAGDQIDLMASMPAGDGESADAKSAEVRLLAQDAMVLRPVYVRNEAATSASLTQGTRIQSIPKYEVAIAVHPDDVIPLQTALNQKLALTCIAHSMKPANDAKPKTMVSRPDEIRVPVTVRPILAYDVVARDAFVSAATRTIKTESISRQLADRLDVILSLDEALGAITRHDIPAGRYLRRSDLLQGPPQSNTFERKQLIDDSLEAARSRQGSNNPLRLTSMQHDGHDHAVQPSVSAPSATSVGDRPAITRFIPPDRTAFAIPWTRIYGGEHLQIGDTIDLMASYSLERLRDEEETETRPDGTVIVRKSESLTPRTTQRTWEESFGNRAEPWFVASDAIVVAPVGFPAPSSALRVLGNQISDSASRRGNQANQLDGPPVIIAVDQRDVEAVATALATRDALFTIAFHSSEPTSGGRNAKRIVIAPEALDAYTVIDENGWKGNRRRMIVRTVAADNPRYLAAITEDEIVTYYGRVLGVAKSRGEALLASDFLAPGNRPGIAASGRAGFTLLPIADREIEGLDAFTTGDHVAILLRGVLRLPTGDVRRALAGEPAVSSVVAQSVRIARPSTAGQTILEVNNAELTRLQAAIARSLTDRDSLSDRSHLVAVGLAREDTMASDASVTTEIDTFDPLAGIRTTEVIIGGRRTVEVFSGAQQ